MRIHYTKQPSFLIPEPHYTRRYPPRVPPSTQSRSSASLRFLSVRVSLTLNRRLATDTVRFSFSFIWTRAFISPQADCQRVHGQPTSKRFLWERDRFLCRGTRVCARSRVTCCVDGCPRSLGFVRRLCLRRLIPLSFDCGLIHGSLFYEDLS